jgi:hypothetical protein
MYARVLRNIGQGSLELFSQLTPVGRDYLRALVEHSVVQGDGDRAALDMLYGLDYDRVPPDPATWLDHTDYCGHVGKSMWPAWRPHFLAACDPSRKVHELILTGPPGLGKTVLAMAVLAFKITRLSHLRDPARFYGLASKSKIVFGLYCVTMKLIKDVGFYDLRDVIIDQSPYFREVMVRTPFGKEAIYWPSKGIQVIVGSTALHALSANIIAVAADELNYYAQGEKTAVRADALTHEVSTRMESRFIDYAGGVPGVVILISQTRTKQDFLENRIRAAVGKPGVYVVRGPRWEFAPGGYERLAEDGLRDARTLGPHPAQTCVGPVPGFRLFTGDDVRDPLVLDKVERKLDGTWAIAPVDAKAPTPEGEILSVPVIHYPRFTADLHGAMRAVADRPTGGYTPFFPRREVIAEAFDESLPFPFRAQTVPCYEGQPGELADAFEVDLVTRIAMGRRVPIRHPDALRYIHLDLSLTRDLTGFAMVHPAAHYQATEPVDDDDPAKVGRGVVKKDVEVDFYVGLMPGPQGEPINYERVRMFIDFLRRIGFRIQWATSDQFMSADHLMRLRDTGIQAEVLSVDRTSRPYRDLRQVMNERRVKIPYPLGGTPTQRGLGRDDALLRVILFVELASLEHDVDEDKVDHRSQNIDGTRGSKDCGDGLTGAVHKCLTDEVSPTLNPQARSVHQRERESLNRYLRIAPF